MIINSQVCRPKTNLKDKIDQYLETFVPEKKGELKLMLHSNRSPSKKKLRRLFQDFPVICSQFHHILEKKVFIEAFLRKREATTKRIILKYLDLRDNLHVNEHRLAVALESAFKSFPWSYDDVESACDTLFELVRTQDMRASVSKQGEQPPALDTYLPTYDIDLNESPHEIEKDSFEHQNLEGDFSFIFQIIQSPFITSNPRHQMFDS